MNILTDKRCFCTLSLPGWWWLIGQDWTRLRRWVGRTRTPAPSCAPGQRKSNFLPNAEKACTLAAKIDTMRSLGRPPRLKDLSKIFWKFVEWCDLFDFKVNFYVIPLKASLIRNLPTEWRKNYMLKERTMYITHLVMKSWRKRWLLICPLILEFQESNDFICLIIHLGLYRMLWKVKHTNE